MEELKKLIVMTKDILDNQGELILADMYEYDYPLNTYGLIISHATLHHGKKKNVLTF